MHLGSGSQCSATTVCCNADQVRVQEPLYLGLPADSWNSPSKSVLETFPSSKGAKKGGLRRPEFRIDTKTFPLLPAAGIF